MDQKKYTGKKGYSIILRPGESTRCERYCLVKGLCNQYKDTILAEVKKAA
jgi:hypothetical protein